MTGEVTIFPMEMPVVDYAQFWSPLVRHYMKQFVSATKDMIIAYEERKAVAPARISDADIAKAGSLMNAYVDASWGVEQAVAGRNRAVYSVLDRPTSTAMAMHADNVDASVQGKMEAALLMGQGFADLPPGMFDKSADFFWSACSWGEAAKCLGVVKHLTTKAGRACVENEMKRIGKYLWEKCPDMIHEIEVGDVATDLEFDMLCAEAADGMAIFRHRQPRLGFVVNG